MQLSQDLGQSRDIQPIIILLLDKLFQNYVVGESVLTFNNKYP